MPVKIKSTSTVVKVEKLV